MALIHKILQYAEEHADGYPIETPEFSGFSKEQINYHILLSHEAGWLRIKETGIDAHGVRYYEMLNLTWNGQEELARFKRESRL